jgi:archaellum biogenesis ATPase FlaH
MHQLQGGGGVSYLSFKTLLDILQTSPKIDWDMTLIIIDEFDSILFNNSYLFAELEAVF